MRLRRLITTVGIAACALFPAASAFAAASPSIHGTAVSSLPDDTRRLSVQGQLGHRWAGQWTTLVHPPE